MDPRMLEIAIPGYKHLQLEHLILDYNGTLACDGHLVAGVRERLQALTAKLQIHVLTADTFGKAQSGIQEIPCVLHILPAKDQDLGKLEYTKRLGSSSALCIGNGRNDRLMLEEAALGIAVILGEGAATEALLAADLVCSSIISTLAPLAHPLRLVASLRS